MLRIKALFGVALVVAIAGCGGSDSKKSDDKPDAGSKADAQKLLAQTFGPNPKARSGQLNGTIDIYVDGVPRFEPRVELSMSGPFRQDKGADPAANLSMGIELRGKIYGGDLILANDQVLIGLGSTGYQIPDDIAARLRRPLKNSRNGLGAILNVFGIAPRRWAKHPRIVGNENVNGEDTIHGTAQIDAKAYFLDVAKLTNALTSLRITEVAGVPTRIDAADRAALARSVTSSKGDIWTGAEDHVMRKASFAMRLKPSAKDRRRLGFQSMRLTGNLEVTDVGGQQALDVPTARGSYPELQVTLDAIAESVRNDAGQAP